jgi:hypothetical protein
VRVVQCMAGFTACRTMHLILCGLLMTAEAVESVVRTVERKARLKVVIEAPYSPIVGGVAGFALGTEPPLVGVERFVAGYAFVRSVLEGEGVVAILAGRKSVKAEEWKS